MRGITVIIVVACEAHARARGLLANHMVHKLLGTMFIEDVERAFNVVGRKHTDLGRADFRTSGSRGMHSIPFANMPRRRGTVYKHRASSTRACRAACLKPPSLKPSPSNAMLSGTLAASDQAVHSSNGCFLGIDFGTSGARATAIDRDGHIVAESRRSYPEFTPETAPDAWQTTLYALIRDLPADVRSHVDALAVDGTSSTAMLFDIDSGSVIAAPKMYNDKCQSAMPLVESIAPAGHTVRSATSTLCKLISWYEAGVIKGSGHEVLMHQCDWLSYLLHGVAGATDYHNALKLGYDPSPSLGNGTGAYPSWLMEHHVASALPKSIYSPGQPVGRVQLRVAQMLGLSHHAVVCAGTTDSIAAFLAARPSRVGQAVTSLGSTLAIKLLSTTRVDDAKFGIYSHRLGDFWLVGGASNTGGSVLRELFTDEQLVELSNQIDATKESHLDYYPLNSPGERFPENNPELLPRLEPRPQSDVEFLHGILESIAKIEAKGFALMKRMGASDLGEVFTAGGGAKNAVWMKIRSRILGVNVSAASQVEASYGAAVLARSTWLAVDVDVQ